jgi:hypothetical protein
MLKSYPTYLSVKIDDKTFTAKAWRNIDTGEVALSSKIYKMQEYTTSNGNKRLRKMRVSPVSHSEIYQKALVALDEKAGA